jgi:hypothetical protein
MGLRLVFGSSIVLFCTREQCSLGFAIISMVQAFELL